MCRTEACCTYANLYIFEFRIYTASSVRSQTVLINFLYGVMVITNEIRHKKY